MIIVKKKKWPFPGSRNNPEWGRAIIGVNYTTPYTVQTENFI